MNRQKIIFSLLFICSLFAVKAQVSVVNIQLMPYNITSEALLAATLNSADARQVQLVSTLYDFNGEVLITVRSGSFSVKQGLNNAFEGGRKVASAVYSSGARAEYIKTTKGLPSGVFKVCIDVINSGTMEVQDQFCDEIESNFNQYMYLVYPPDKEVTDTRTPMLTWTHSEPFSILTQGEYYRMIVTEIKTKQAPEEAITVNTPLMTKNYLTVHSLQYPYDGKELAEGKHYAWQVQKIANGVVVNKTEAWEFSIDKKPEEKETKYVALKQVIDGSVYTTYGKIYFKFSEDYNSKGLITAYIRSEKGKEFPVTINKDDDKMKSPAGSKIKTVGDNRFILDLDKDNIVPGYYMMEIKNEKKEVYYLKFYFPE
jgi:hypothetical protein